MFELGARRQVRAGEVLFSPADDHYDWVVILSGSVEVHGPNDQLITRHGARRFLGEVGLVTRQRPYLSTRVAESGVLVVVPAEVLTACASQRRSCAIGAGRTLPSSLASWDSGFHQVTAVDAANGASIWSGSDLVTLPALVVVGEPMMWCRRGLIQRCANEGDRGDG